MATFNELREILDYRTLGAVYEEYGRMGAVNPLFDYYVGGAVVDASAEVAEVLDDGGTVQDVSPVSSAGNGSVERFETDTFEYIFIGREKSQAPLNKRGAAARVLQPTASSSRKMTMAHVFNSLQLGMDSLRALREPDNHVLQKMGRTEVLKQVKDFGTKHAVMKQVFLSKALTDGVVYISPAGMIQESSSGAEITIDLGVPSTHKSQINVGGSNVIAAAWDVAGTDIIKQLDNLRVAAEIENAEPPKHIWVNSKNKFWFRENTNLKAYYSGVRPINELFNGDSFELEGYTFHFFAGTYTDLSGSTQYYVPLDQVIITPELGPWFLNAIGMEYVPSTIDVAGSTDEVLSTTTEVYGDFAYAKLEHNPVSVNLFTGTNFMYGFRNPKSIWMPTVDF